MPVGRCSCAGFTTTIVLCADLKYHYKAVWTVTSQQIIQGCGWVKRNDQELTMNQWVNPSLPKSFQQIREHQYHAKVQTVFCLHNWNKWKHMELACLAASLSSHLERVHSQDIDSYSTIIYVQYHSERDGDLTWQIQYITWHEDVPWHSDFYKRHEATEESSWQYCRSDSN